LPTFVGRYGGTGVLGWDGVGTSIDGVVVWIAEGRIGVFVDGPDRTVYPIGRFLGSGVM
jgi:hypothetical protein